MQVHPNGPNGGTGLGLSISTALAKMMNNTGLGVTSAPNVGSNFFFDVTLEVWHSQKPKKNHRATHLSQSLTSVAARFSCE
ncbi:hypothetical protein SARC_16721 [Sphaeroforma arctica JP610]|uniref:Histidine kinase/HSP90-like ATPase domain-containing protein n=1 Tax=Sphaeroforma arctica JP610 TaxID=667725 RepID=A0A0L0F2B2_9EUKA|nr:hypothetical protein SARC_16721 [Sphaeroforma arctica JP610]KNC70749.1 hypothetical protein SARC_16721 [Sphaeroforma arctica JP610]|eukprot:XP_014144651.1 hypothetical protein SARC_16721 [Sphaeroforma arctica JP610]